MWPANAAASPRHDFFAGNSQDAIALIAATLENVVRQNQDLRQSQPTSFDAVSAPAITVHRYLSRIRQYTKFQDECYVVALVYLDRLFQNHKAPFLPTAHNVHRLVITSVLLASKFYDDVFHSNSFMAQVGGISVAEMNKLEIELCLRLNWDLHVVYDEYLLMIDSLLQPTDSLWKRWQHQHALAFSSDEETVSAEATEAGELGVAAPPPVAVVAKSLLPSWSFRTRDASPGVGREAGESASRTTSGSKEATTVSVR